MKEDCHKCPIVTATENMIACDIYAINANGMVPLVCNMKLTHLTLVGIYPFLSCAGDALMSKASLLESGGVGAVHNIQNVFVISITCTAPLFIIANKTHMHTHCSRESVAHKITPVSLRS